MRTQVFAAGLLAADERGTLFIRHRADPYEINDPTTEAGLGSVADMRVRSDRLSVDGSTFARRATELARYEKSETGAETWSRRVRTDPRYIKVLDPDNLAPGIPAYTGLIGTVGSAALEGREPPVITLEEVADYPSVNRDDWDELVPVDTGFLIVEGTPDFHRPGPSRIVSGNHPCEPADFDAAEAGSDAIHAEPLWDGLHSSGAGYVEGKGLTNHLGVPIVTDAMRNWLLLSPHLIYVRPIVQRPADLRR